MSEIQRDPVLGLDQPLAEGERLLATLTADGQIYIRNHLIIVVVFGFIAGVVLWWIDNPTPWVGPLAAALAIGTRAAYLRSEALGQAWRVTDRRLLGPGGRAVGLADIREARPFFGDVQIITQSGDKHLIKYQREAARTIAAITDARNGKRRKG